MTLYDNYSVRTQRLYEALTTGKGLQGIVDIAAEVFNNPVLVADTSFKVLAHAEKPDTNNTLWQDIVNTGYYPSNYIHSTSKDDKVYAQVFSTDAPKLISDGVSPNRFFCKMVTIRGKPVGFATCVENDTPLTEQDAGLFKVFCDVAGTELRSDELMAQGYHRRRDYFISEMISGPVKADFLEERLRQVELRVKSCNFILVAEFADEKMRREHQMAYYGIALEQLIPDSCCIAYRNSLLALISRDNPNLFSGNFLTKILNHLETTEMLCGISHCFRNIAEMNIHYKQAGEAIRLGRKRGCDSRIFDYARMSIYHMIDIAGQTEELRAFCNPKLLDIFEYDSNYSTKYAQTIYEYFKHNRNPAKTAEYLNIHQ